MVHRPDPDPGGHRYLADETPEELLRGQEAGVIWSQRVCVHACVCMCVRECECVCGVYWWMQYLVAGGRKDPAAGFGLKNMFKIFVVTVFVTSCDRDERLTWPIRECVTHPLLHIYYSARRWSSFRFSPPRSQHVLLAYSDASLRDMIVTYTCDLSSEMIIQIHSLIHRSDGYWDDVWSRRLHTRYQGRERFLFFATLTKSGAWF